MEKSRKPKIRFKGYNDDWEQRKLGDCIFELKSGLSRMLSEEDIGMPVVRANNIENDKLDMSNNVKYWYVNDPQGVDTLNYTISKNDILINFINSENKMGTAAIVEKMPNRPTIYARGHRLEVLQNQGLLYKKNNIIKKVDIKVIDHLQDNDIYDFIFLTVRENQLYQSLKELKSNKSKI